MESVIERNVMVNSGNDSSRYKLDSESRLHQQQRRQSGSPTTVASTVNLSDAPQKLDALKKIIADAPDSNRARVEFLKAELSAGRYQINCQQIAQQMLTKPFMS